MAFCSFAPPLFPAADRSEWEANVNLSVPLMSYVHMERMDKWNSQAGTSRLSPCPSHLHTPAPARELELQALTPGETLALGWSSEWVESPEIVLCSAGPVSACAAREARLDGSLDLLKTAQELGLFLRHWATRQEAELPVGDYSEEPESFPNPWPQRDRRVGSSDP